MLRPAQSDSFRTKLSRCPGIFRVIRIGENMKRTDVIRPPQHLLKLFGHFGILERNRSANDPSGRAVKRNPLPF